MEETIRSIIKREVKDDLPNHIKTALFLREDYYCGTFDSDEFKIWKYSYRRTGVFYPVIIGKLIGDKEKPKLQIRTKMNSFGKLIQWLILLGVSLGLLESEIISFNLDFAHLVISLGGLMLILLFLTPIRMIYWHTKKNAINEFKELIMDVSTR